MLTYFLLGAAIGAITGVPIGPVNVAVIDAAYRHTLRRALAVGLGGACADGLYALLGIVGVGPLISSYDAVTPILYGLSGTVLIVYGFLTVRTQPVTPASNDAPRSPTPSKEMWSGFMVGLSLIVLNPAAIVTWVIIVGRYLSVPNHIDGIAATVGVFVGSLAWFWLVAYLTNHGKHVMGDKAVWIPRAVGIGLIGYGLYSLYMAADALS